MNPTEVCQYESSDGVMSIVEKPVKKSSIKRTPKIWLHHKSFKNETEVEHYMKEQTNFCLNFKNFTSEGKY